MVWWEEMEVEQSKLDVSAVAVKLGKENVELLSKVGRDRAAGLCRFGGSIHHDIQTLTRLPCIAIFQIQFKKN